MVRAAFCAYILMFFTSLQLPLLAQDETSGGPDSIIAGPYGVPRLVMDEGGSWDIPIKVFEDDKYEVFVPDLTSPAWVQWHIGSFRTKGLYFTYIYSYEKRTRSIERDLIYVNPSTQRAIIENFPAGIRKIDLAKGPVVLTKSIARITEIVREEFARYNGPTLEDAIKQDERIQARAVAEIENPDAPAYVPEASDGKQSTIALPTVIKSPLAEYSLEARRLKINGTVMVTTTIDTEGRPQNLRIFKSVGYGLDEQAIAAVKQYVFSPAVDKRTGKPVEFQVTISVKYQLY